MTRNQGAVAMISDDKSCRCLDSQENDDLVYRQRRVRAVNRRESDAGVQRATETVLLLIIHCSSNKNIIRMMMIIFYLIVRPTERAGKYSLIRARSS